MPLMTETTLKTDLSSLEVIRSPLPGDTAQPIHYLQASYWSGCPLPRGSETLHLGSRTLLTHILSAPAVKPAEPGVYYRLPLVACEALGVDMPLSLIPFLIEIEHNPYTGFAVDGEGHATPTSGAPDNSVHTTALWTGSRTLCGLFRTETAAKWASLPSEAWRMPRGLAIERAHGLDASWLHALNAGAVRLSYCESLLTRPVEVFRETA
jgi:hypothetical protein